MRLEVADVVGGHVMCGTAAPEGDSRTTSTCTRTDEVTRASGNVGGHEGVEQVEHTWSKRDVSRQLPGHVLQQHLHHRGSAQATAGVLDHVPARRTPGCCRAGRSAAACPRPPPSCGDGRALGGEPLRLGVDQQSVHVEQDGVQRTSSTVRPAADRSAGSTAGCPLTGTTERCPTGGRRPRCGDLQGRCASAYAGRVSRGGVDDRA